MENFEKHPTFKEGQIVKVKAHKVSNEKCNRIFGPNYKSHFIFGKVVTSEKVLKHGNSQKSWIIYVT